MVTQMEKQVIKTAEEYNNNDFLRAKLVRCYRLAYMFKTQETKKKKRRGLVSTYQ